MTARISYPLLLAAFFLTGTVSLFGQLELKIQLEPDGKTYGVYARPDSTINPSPTTITGSGQVTVVMPVGFQWHSLTSHSGQWSNDASVIGPQENPSMSYYSVGLQAAEPTYPIVYSQGEETLLFTFISDCICPDTLYLIDCNTASGVTDPFCPDFPDSTPGMNSDNDNPGNDLSVVDFGVSPTGFYYFTDNYGLSAWSCPDTNGDEIGDEQTDTLNILVEQLGCNRARLTGVYSDDATSYSWSNGSTDSEVVVTQAGLHTLTVRNANGCPRSATVDVIFIDDTGCPVINGTIHWDQSGTCQPHPDHPPFKEWLVEVIGTEGTYYGLTDGDGAYEVTVDTGDYVVAVHPASYLWEVCENAVPVSFPGFEDTSTVAFLVNQLDTCAKLTVNIGSWRLRRCTTNYYSIHYCNEGTAVAEDAFVEVAIDSFLVFESSPLPSTHLGDNTYRFELGNVEAGDCASFRVYVNVPCDVPFDITHCSSVHIYPDDPCLPPDPLWTGANLQATAECQDSVKFVIKNSGFGTMSGPLSYLILQDNQPYLFQESDPLAPGEEKFIYLPADGSDWRIEVDQEPLHPLYTQVSATLEGCGGSGGVNVATGFTEHVLQYNADDFSDQDCQPNIGSYDPNDKAATPAGYGDEHFIADGTEIEYKIRFQNKGTDTAFMVVIVDTLAPELDITTFRPLASSHPYEVQLSGAGILAIDFPGIQLPHAAVDETGSNGFITFEISVRDSLIPLTEVKNAASIYFDYNPPIHTNTVLHTIEKPVVHSFQTVEICENESWNGQVYTSDTTVAETIEFTWYDSMAWTEIRVKKVFDTLIHATICEGDSYWFDNQQFTQAGAYEQINTSVTGCDSIITLTLTVKEDIEQLVDASICEGRSYKFGGEELSEPGKYMHTYSDGACDSTVVLNLSVLPSYDLTIEETVEAGGTFHGVPVFSDTTFKESHLSVHGCDSIVTTHVKVATPVKNSLQEAIGMEIFPNPAGEKVNIRFNLPQTSRGKIRILDVVGRQVQFDSGESRYESGKHSFEIETREWPAGMYLVQLQLENEWAMAKLVVR